MPLIAAASECQYSGGLLPCRPSECFCRTPTHPCHPIENKQGRIMSAYLIDFTNLLLRWLHVIAAIAWVGESIYFVMLDNSLKKPQAEAALKQGVACARRRFLPQPKIPNQPRKAARRFALVVLEVLHHLAFRLCAFLCTLFEQPRHESGQPRCRLGMGGQNEQW